MGQVSTYAILVGFALGEALGQQVAALSPSDFEAAYGAGDVADLPASVSCGTETSGLLMMTRWLLDAGSVVDDPLPDMFDLAGHSHVVAQMLFVGYVYRKDEQRLSQVAQDVIRRLDDRPAVIASGIASALLIKLALDDVPVQAYLRRIVDVCGGMSETFDRAMLRVGHVIGWGSERHALRHLGDGSNVEELIALMIYILLRYPDDYQSAVQRAATIRGANSVVAGMVGAVTAARLGINAIPQEWRECLSAACDEQLHAMSDRLHGENEWES